MALGRETRPGPSLLDGLVDVVRRGQMSPPPPGTFRRRRRGGSASRDPYVIPKPGGREERALVEEGRRAVLGKNLTKLGFK